MARLHISSAHGSAVCDVRHDAMRDSILSRPLPRCIEMESAHFHSAMQRNGVRPLRVCDTHNARAAFANLLFHAASENVRACFCHFSIRAKLDLSAFALARFLNGRVGALCRPDAAARCPCRTIRFHDHFLRALRALRG